MPQQNRTLIEEALSSIREKDIRSATLERMRITREVDEMLRYKPQPQQLSEGLYYLLDKISVPVSPNDLLVGRILEEVPDEESEAFFSETVKEWNGRGIPPWMPDGGHECFDWERILRLGLAGLEDFAQQERSRRIAARETGAHLDWLACAARVYQAFRNYARRYAQAARQVGSAAAAHRCKALAERPPETFAEGLQLIWLVTHVYCTMVSANPTLTMGRVDQLLLDLYREDIAADRLTRDEAGALIEDFYAKNNIILGRGEHQMDGGSGKATGWQRNLAYDAPQYMFLGGYRSKSQDGWTPPSANELTELFLELIVPAFENPVVVLRYTRDVPDKLWRLACEKMRANASILVYNDEVVIPAFMHAGIPEAHAIEYSMFGCNWPITSGNSRTVVHRRPLLPAHFLNALNGANPSSSTASEIPSNETDTEHTQTPPSSIDELYERFAASFSSELDEVRAQYSDWRKSRDEKAPGLLRIDDCFLDGPVANARSWSLGGTPMSTVIIGIMGLATTIDCFAAVDELVFNSTKVSIEELRAALRGDFADDEPLRQLCIHAPKFGRDDDRADRHAARLLSTVSDEIDRASKLDGRDDIIILRSLTMDMTHRSFGAEVGATPDGRHAGDPISENMSPCPGSCTEGLTSMFHSLAKLPLNRINSGPLNVRIQPKLVEGESGLKNLAAALRGYFDMEGLQVQLSFVSTDQLRDAQRNPEAYRDLMVRITGYSAVFVDMSSSAQEEIIRRAEMGT